MAAPVVVLVETSLPENLGAVARVMANFGATQLRLVAPACSPDDPRARAVAAWGEPVLVNADRYPDLRAALHGCTEAWGTAALPRRMEKLRLDPRQAAPRLTTPDRPVAVVFGPERTGLRYEHLDVCTGLIHIPTTPAARALNLAQAAAIVLWECHSAAGDAPIRAPTPAPVPDQAAFADRLEAALAASGWLSDPVLRAKTSRNLRAALLRAGFTPAELRTLTGALAALTRPTPPEPP